MPADDLFLEIGTEEIPSGFLGRAFEDLCRLAEKTLAEARIAHGEARALGTPRRLVLAVSDVAESQESLEERVMGPAKSVAYDESGNPSKAALGFAKGQGVAVESLEIVETGKGEYVSAVRKEEGRPAAEVLPERLPALIQALGFRKSMRWGDGDLRFARPIHWIVAILGGRVIPFELGGVASGDRSRGHRFMAPGEFGVEGLEAYIEEARERFVIVDPEERTALTRQLAEAAAREAGGAILPDDDLLEEVAGLVEYPTPILGAIESEYLDLPREVLITTMKHHQRYFSVINGKGAGGGARLPNFVAVSNTRAGNPDVIRKGYECVLRARLSDAAYFYREDVKRPLEDYVELLKGVIFQKDIGTSFEKVERVVELARWLAGRLAPDEAQRTTRAAWLCKADLETRMIYEFPELQGIMGREYARLSGEEEAVCRAIDEHYRPRGAEEGFASAGPAAFVAIADKLDTIVGYVGLGKLPSGSADPFGLRRAARGVLGTILAHGYRLDLHALIREAAKLLAERLKNPDPETLATDSRDFLMSRLENLLLADGFRVDLVRAVLDARTGSCDVLDAKLRLKALSAIAEEEDFEPLTTTFKRVMNIIPEENLGEVREDLFQDEAEKALNMAFQERGERIRSRIENQEFSDALREIASLRPAVDKFFDDVLVMAEDADLRNNRLSLLASIGGLFAQVADFRKIFSNVSRE
ncbi:MAG: glycine--tRNA ligase subunit beta [Nitrospinota bacterium]|nr:glycine--tRNA ligase subunit beta [Nitrospinota bacterium]